MTQRLPAPLAPEVVPLKTKQGTDISEQFVARPDFRHTDFLVEEYIKNDLALRIDLDDELCKDWAATHACPRGALCPLRHVRPSIRNFRPMPAEGRGALSKTICKHWLKGLCKKGPGCEFLHELNMRKMPECWFFTQFRFCASGDDCMYLHLVEAERLKDCEAYTRGFCHLGPSCPDKHSRKTACPSYLNGFCPLGAHCSLVHPPWLRDQVQARVNYKEPKDAYRNRDRDWPEEVGGKGGDWAPAYRADGGPTIRNQNQPRRALNEVTCYKCGEKGHFANNCMNRGIPGDRGGLSQRMPQMPKMGGAGKIM
ncbi:uncharacterized protein L969DRAFT_86418 [Mixia osmundae IAM 14324]|uniref:mRNA 3'-end-processing protein n=1 Tax=Mixia osmundae (strain CBS 9802 / IAM 14324 / JCM 22182 / KY 12970) TaxID=764103 RepID=G7E988_MIXOS|nr:uncharacterized protein L969DRAFT_86418 [Mixia osmundae IAM 14324]KEI39830.1 hypothetical protein L969DRAFT_86418 [Mixia osmundae IAM 14324]GAA99207.1 hypothetical protein E5Q_05900 [Mixia osmundae IAM 14324]